MIAFRSDVDPPPRTSVASTIVEIAQLSDGQKAALRRAICAGDGFNLSEIKQQELATVLGKSKLETGAILRTLENFYEFLNDYGSERTNREEQRRTLIESLSRLDPLVKYAENIESVADSVLPLVALDKNIELSRKRRRLREGLIPNAIGFTSFVDLRPNFQRDGNEIDSISEFVLQIQFFIHSDISQQGSAPQVYQLDESGLNELRDAVRLMDEKVKFLSNFQIGAPLRK